jgi:hypothetical protein
MFNSLHLVKEYDSSNPNDPPAYDFDPEGPVKGKMLYPFTTENPDLLIAENEADESETKKKKAGKSETKKKKKADEIISYAFLRAKSLEEIDRGNSSMLTTLTLISYAMFVYTVYQQGFVNPVLYAEYKLNQTIVTDESQTTFSWFLGKIPETANCLGNPPLNASQAEVVDRLGIALMTNMSFVAFSGVVFYFYFAVKLLRERADKFYTALPVREDQRKAFWLKNHPRRVIYYNLIGLWMDNYFHKIFRPFNFVGIVAASLAIVQDPFSALEDVRNAITEHDVEDNPPNADEPQADREEATQLQAVEVEQETNKLRQRYLPWRVAQLVFERLFMLILLSIYVAVTYTSTSVPSVACAFVVACIQFGWKLVDLFGDSSLQRMRNALSCRRGSRVKRTEGRVTV